MEGQQEVSVVEKSTSNEAEEEETNIDAEKDVNVKEVACSSGLQNHLPRSPVSSPAGDTSNPGVERSSEGTLSTDGNEAVISKESLGSETEPVLPLVGPVAGGADGTGGSFINDGGSSTSPVDCRAASATQENESPPKELITKCSVSPAVPPAAYLTLMTRVFMSQVREGQSVSRSSERDAVTAGLRCGVEGSRPMDGSVSKEYALVDGGNSSPSNPSFPNLSGHTVPECESVSAFVKSQSLSSDGLNIASGSNSAAKMMMPGERETPRSSTSGLDLDDFWEGGDDPNYSMGPKLSGDEQRSISTVSESRLTENNAAGAQSRVLAEINEAAAPTQCSASGRDHGRSACAGYVSAVSGLRETGPTEKEDSALTLASERAESERAVARNGDEVPPTAVATGDVVRTVSSSFCSKASPEERCQATPCYRDSGCTVPDPKIRELSSVHHPTPTINCAQDVVNLRTLSSSEHSTTQSSAAISSGEGEASLDNEANLVASGDTVAVAPATGRASSSRRIPSKGVRSSTRRGSSRGNCTSEDIIHAMCMICLENLSNTTKGGGQKMLGLIDSCTHRYCYNCILEWSKVTNRCPQCKSRFHTIKAVKELRESGSRYRGVAVSVEDRDQKYSFVDVRDVVVLDPEVRCHSSCLLLGALDALQEQGWEFSVQCERCSEWFHGLCVGFREESAVPDLWICRSCRGLVQTVGNRNSTTSAGLNASGARHRASSGRIRSRSRRAQQGSGQPPPSIPVRRQEARESSDGSEESQRRNSLGLRRAASAPIEATHSVSPRLTLSSMASVPSLVRASSTSSAPPEASATSSRGRGKSKGKRRSSSDSPSSSQEPLTEAPPRRVRGRRMPETMPVSATQAESLAAQDSTKASSAIPRPAQSRTSPRLSQSSAAQLASTRGRERPRLLELPTESTRTTKRPTSPAMVPPRRCGDRPVLSLTLSSSPSPLPETETSVSNQFTAAASLPAISMLTTAPPTVPSHIVPAPTVPEPVVSAQSVPLLTVQAPVGPGVASTCAVPAPGLPAPAVSAPVISSLTAPAPSERVPDVTIPDVPEATMPNVGMLAPAIEPDMTMPSPAIPVAGMLAQALQTTAVEMPDVSLSTQDEDTRRFSEPPPRDLGLDTLASSESSSPVPENPHFADADVSRKGKSSLKEARTILPKAPVLPFLQSLEAPQATDLCDICGFDTERDNLIVYCGSCNMGVHQTCYGISKIPNKEWLCSPCSAGVHPSTLSCRFCPVKGGALKRCTDGSWGHILCAFWIPECCFLDPDEMEPIGSINKRGESGEVEKFLPSFRSRKCYVCGTSKGCVIRCHTNSCKFHFHPMCGSKAGSVYMEIETTMKIRPDGEEFESVTLVARCPRHDKRKTGINRDRRSRSFASPADPMGLVGRTLEMTEDDDSNVLKGKVTWFNPEKSIYCLVESGVNKGAGSGDAPADCVHWIAGDKLVEVKAVCIETRRKERFVVEMPPAGCEKQAGDKTDKAADIENRPIKPEWRGGASLCDQNHAERGDEQRHGGIVEHPNLESAEPDEESSETRRGKKRLREKTSSRSESLDAQKPKRVALEAQKLTMVRPSWCDSEVTKQELPHASQFSMSGDFYIQSTMQDIPLASEGGASGSLTTQVGEGAVTIAAGQQPTNRSRVAAVQVQIEPSDSWGGYPTRGRLRQQSNSARRHSDSGIQRSVLSTGLSVVKQEVTNEIHSPNCCPFASHNSTETSPIVGKGTVPPANVTALPPESGTLLWLSRQSQDEASTTAPSERDESCAPGPIGPVDVNTRVAKVKSAPAGAPAPESSVLASSHQSLQDQACSKRDETGGTNPIGPIDVNIGVAKVTVTPVGSSTPECSAFLPDQGHQDEASLKARFRRDETDATSPINANPRAVKATVDPAGPPASERLSSHQGHQDEASTAARSKRNKTDTTSPIGPVDVNVRVGKATATLTGASAQESSVLSSDQGPQDEASLKTRSTRDETSTTSTIGPVDVNVRVGKATATLTGASAQESSVLSSDQGPQDEASPKTRSTRDETSTTSTIEPVDVNIGVGKVAVTPVGSSAPESSGLLSSYQGPQEVSTTTCSKRDDTGDTSPIRAAGHDKRPGWSYGIAFPGNVPIMRIHSVLGPGGQEAKYFAGDYSKQQSVKFDPQSTMTFSFPFEDLDEIRVSRTREQTDASRERKLDFSGSPHRIEGKSMKSKRQQIHVESPNGRDSNPPTDGSNHHAEEQPKMEVDKLEDDEGTEKGALTEDSIPSSLSPDDTSDMEEGELEASADGRPNITPPSPRDNMEVGSKKGETGSEGGKTSTFSHDGMKEGTHRNGDPQDMPLEERPASGHQAFCTESLAEEEMLNSEDMEISSDDMSTDEVEREDAVSSVSSDGDVASAGSDRLDTREWEPTQDNTAGWSAELSHPEGPGSTCTQLMDEEESAVPHEQETATLGVSASVVEELAGNAKLRAPACGEELERPRPSDPLREIVRQNLEIRLSAGKGEDAMLEDTNAADVSKRISFDVEAELFRRLYRDETEGHEYKAKYKQLMLSLGNTRNHRLVDSVLAGKTTPVDLATKDAVGLLKSLNSSLNCEAIPLTGRNGQALPGLRGRTRKSNRRGKMVLLG